MGKAVFYIIPYIYIDVPDNTYQYGLLFLTRSICQNCRIRAQIGHVFVRETSGGLSLGGDRSVVVRAWSPLWGGGGREVLLLRKGGREKVLAMLKGGPKTFRGSFYAVA